MIQKKGDPPLPYRNNKHCVGIPHERGEGCGKVTVAVHLTAEEGRACNREGEHDQGEDDQNPHGRVLTLCGEMKV